MRELSALADVLDYEKRHSLKRAVARRLFERDERIDPIGITWDDLDGRDKTYWMALADTAVAEFYLVIQEQATGDRQV